MKDRVFAPLVLSLALTVFPLMANAESEGEAGSQQADPAAGEAQAEGAAGGMEKQAEEPADELADETRGEKRDAAAATAESKGEAEQGAAATYVSAQEEGQMLASELIGTGVRNPNDESLGEVEDVLFNEEEGVRAVIVGVGGFLGIGKKNVAVSYQEVRQSRDEDGNLTLALDASKEALEGAPTFKTLNEQRSEEQAQQAQQELQQQQQQPIQQQE